MFINTYFKIWQYLWWWMWTVIGMPLSIKCQCQDKDNTCENKTETTSAAEPWSGKTLLLFHTSHLKYPQSHSRTVTLFSFGSGILANFLILLLLSSPLQRAACKRILICEHSYSVRTTYKSHSALPCSPSSWVKTEVLTYLTVFLFFKLFLKLLYFFL